MNSSLLVCIVLFSILETADCFGYRTINNHAYTGLISERRYDVDWLGCIEACSHSENCVSYNYKWRPNADEDSVCELIDERGDDGDCDTSSLTYVPGFAFQMIKENNKGTSCKEPCKVFADCNELLLAGKTQSGVYSINPDGNGDFDVFCDQSTQGGGWIVFQKRFNGLVDFFRNWTSYKLGFGNLTGEFWLGFDKIHRLTSLKRNTLRVDLGDFNNATAYAEYDDFRVLNEHDSYRLDRLGNYTGTSGDSLSRHTGYPFSTEDSDSGNCTAGNCATLFHGAWWYMDYFRSNLNGRYRLPHETLSLEGVIWATWREIVSLKKTEMKMRPCQDCPSQGSSG